MKVLFCCEFYYPHVGGVQKVIQEIGERLVVKGHEVTVATSFSSRRKSQIHNGVNIFSFDVSGNYTRGIKGEISKYQQFLTTKTYDVVLVKAAQQWTFDAMWDVLPLIKARKIHIPCGYPGLLGEEYNEYYQQMPDILKQFDHLIYYASEYQDIAFAHEHGIRNTTVIPNGASKSEFSVKRDPGFRSQLGISEKDFVLLTVGSITGAKGHKEVLQAYEQLETDAASTLILNGNQPPKNSYPGFWKKLSNQSKISVRSALKWLVIETLRSLKIIPRPTSWENIVETVNTKHSDKSVIVTDFPRNKVVQCFLHSDLFVFASHTEYSPLVLFEAAAAGLPFLSVPVGNAEEIVRWTEGGKICRTKKDKNGFVIVNPTILSQEISKLISDPARLQEMKLKGKKNWEENYYWDKIVLQYEEVLFNQSTNK
ncbi:MAG: glycosyltransferase family 4 protein [Candidatus Neomarinimicrobiota bacterium]